MAGRSLRRAAGAALVGVLGLVLRGGVAGAQSIGADEQEVKAAFVYNFAKFATWPPHAFSGPQAPLTLCELGDVSFTHALSGLHGHPVGQRTLFVRPATLDAAAGCHLLVVGRSEAAGIAAIARTLKGRPVLTVGDAEGFARAGGAIGLTLEGGRVRFEVNPRALDGTGIALSSQLLRLSRIVGDAP